MIKRIKGISERIISLFMVFCVALVLTACGKNGKENKTADSVQENTAETVELTETEQTETDADTEPAEEESEPEAALLPDLNHLVDPDEIQWGYDAPGSDEVQHWYPDGDKLSDYYLMFDGDYLYVCDGDIKDDYSVKVEDGHIVNFQEDGPAIDFVFTDNLTCYDMIEGRWYMRADYDEAIASLTSATFYCEAGDQWNITFHEDGTYSFERDGELIEGEWWFEDANTIDYIDDYGEIWFKITYAEDSWDVLSIQDTDVFYPRD
ncbi:MAG: hypothetical protein ACI4AB_06355 [Acetatifactor sp.]